MYSWFFVALCLSMVVIGETNTVFTFSSDKHEFSNCIENQLSNISLQQEKEWIETLANHTIERFSGKTMEKNSFTRRLRYFFY